MLIKPNELRVTDVTTHAAQRFKERGITRQSILYVLHNGVIRLDGCRETYTAHMFVKKLPDEIRQECTIPTGSYYLSLVISHNGEIITAYWVGAEVIRSKKKWKINLKRWH